MEQIELISKNGKYEAVINIKSEKIMLQVEGTTSIDIEVSVDGNTFISHTIGITITDKDIINLTNGKFMSFIKLISTNNISIKILD